VWFIFSHVVDANEIIVDDVGMPARSDVLFTCIYTYINGHKLKRVA
jgi:hypothetical protein